MPFTIDKKDEGYLLVTLTGALTPALAYEYDEKMNAMLEETGLLPILLDARSGTARVSSIDLFQIARRKSRGLATDCKKALVFHKGIPGVNMYEIIAQSHGQNLKTFRDFDEAETWLLSDEDAPRFKKPPQD